MASARDSTPPTSAAVEPGAATPDAGLTTLPTGELSEAWTTGASLGRFRVRRLLGSGGMGVVLEAEDPELLRRVAIKIVHVGDGSRAEVHRGRLVREAQAAAQLSHPNIITIHDVGTLADGHPFIAMELIEGPTLAQWQRTPRPWREVVERYLAAARGLAAAHDAGLVHRDFKPHNVLLGEHGTVRVSDFGIAALARRQDEPAPAEPLGGDSAGPTDRSDALTAAGEVLGTPAYMPPEQRAGKPVDARADQYAFCVALHEGLTGALPFGDDPVERARRAARNEPVTGHRRPGPRRLYAVLARGLSADPAARYSDMRELIAALGGVLGLRRRWAGAGAAAAIAAAALWLEQSPRAASCDGAEAPWAETWTPAARGAIERAFAAAGQGGELAPRVTEGLARWGRGWVAASQRACVETRVDKVADEATWQRRTACLRSARTVAGNVVAALGSADRALAGSALEVVERLPRPEDCVATSLAAPMQNADARRELDEADTAITIGKLEAALPKVRAVLARARALADRELEALALVRLGRLERRSGKMAEAATTLFDAAIAAEAVRRDELAVEAWAEWIFARARSAPDAATLVDGTRRAHAALDRAGNPLPLRAILLTNEGVAAHLQRDYAAADRLYREALAIRERLFGAKDPRVFDLLDNVSANLDTWARRHKDDPQAKARREEALATSQRALAAREAALGPTHPAVARSLQNLSGMIDARGQRAEARALLERAKSIKEAALGPDHVELASTLDKLADFDEQEGKLERALAGYERALALRVRAAGELSSDTDFERLAVAEVNEALHRPAEAARAFRALAKVRSKDKDRQKAELRAAVAEAVAGEPLGPARAEVRAIVAAWRDAADATATDRARALLASARLGAMAQELDAASRDVDEAERLLGGDAAPHDRAAIAVTRAEVAAAAGRAAQAHDHARAALAACAAAACETAGHELLRRAKLLVRPAR